MSELTKWTEVIEHNVMSADRFHDEDVVRAGVARELAARLEECQKDRQRIIEMIGECCKQTESMANQIGNRDGLPGSEERYFNAQPEAKEAESV